ncbi:MAG: tail tape measure protein, partial [Alistipes sp.]|nr:tail tape measure protein [Alistipes sp.]
TDGVTIEVPVKQADGTFVKKAIKVTVAEFERMKQQVLAIQKELEKKNPFAAFKTSWTELMTAMKSGGDVTGGLSNLNAKGKELTSTIKGWGDSLGAVFGEGFSQSINEMMTMVDGVMDMGTGIAQIFSGDIVGGITSTLSGLAAIIEMFASWKEKSEALKREMYFAEVETNRAIRERNQELAVERDTIQDIITKQELLNWLVEKGFSKPSSVSVWEAQSAALAEYQKNLEAEMSQYDELWEKLQSSNAYWEWRESLSWGSVEHSLRGMSAAEIELYYNQNKLSDAAREYYEAWVESGKTIEELKQHIEETYASLQEMVMGTSFDGFLSNVINAMREARGEISKLASFAEETLAEALINAFKYQHLAKVLEPLYNSLSGALIDDTADAAFIEEWKNLFISVLGNETEKLKALGDALGIDLFESSGTSQNGKSGGFETMTQDQGTKLEGLFTSGQMHWSSIDSKMDNVTNALGDSLDVLEDIKENTDCIPSILDELRKWIRDGIKVK